MHTLSLCSQRWTIDPKSPSYVVVPALRYMLTFDLLQPFRSFPQDLHLIMNTL